MGDGGTSTNEPIEGGISLKKPGPSLFRRGRIFPVLIALFASLTICVSTILAKIDIPSMIKKPCLGNACGSINAASIGPNIETLVSTLSIGQIYSTPTSSPSPTPVFVQPTATGTEESTRLPVENQGPSTSTSRPVSSSTPEKGNGSGNGNGGQGGGNGNGGQGGSNGNGGGKNK